MTKKATISKLNRSGKKFLRALDKLIRSFNFAFFLVSILIWILITGQEIATKPLEIGLLWSAFNIMYAQISFKVSCIFLIIFNGFQSIRLWIFDYYEIKEYTEHLQTLGKIIKKKK
ncbi:hypothetical protein IT412_02540 [Candidatus Peregrinibacteria bacterium]|nr:hypothetical protein [Candidatus Peregrinibacteria bacterium]